MRAGLAAFAVILAATAAQAGELRGRVVAVADGDTLTILDAGRQQRRIRLAEIDAPEKRQPFGQRSKQSLSDLCYGRDAVIEDGGRDRYGRTIGRVSCAGIDANAEQVRRGMAWVFDRYATDRSLYAIQDEARAARRGLWRDPQPVPPGVSSFSVQ
ncbi:MAG: thermonuclease family protein [Burkholderiales bacterium]|nr:thermonuclease family protein [Burkholderiales bacterium]